MTSEATCALACLLILAPSARAADAGPRSLPPRTPGNATAPPPTAPPGRPELALEGGLLYAFRQLAALDIATARRGRLTSQSDPGLRLQCAFMPAAGTALYLGGQLEWLSLGLPPSDQVSVAGSAQLLWRGEAGLAIDLVPERWQVGGELAPGRALFVTAESTQLLVIDALMVVDLTFTSSARLYRGSGWAVDLGARLGAAFSSAANSGTVWGAAVAGERRLGEGTAVVFELGYRQRDQGTRLVDQADQSLFFSAKVRWRRPTMWAGARALGPAA